MINGPTGAPMLLQSPHQSFARKCWHISCELLLCTRFTILATTLIEETVPRTGWEMDPRIIQGKVDAFAQRLLVEADGDPIRALGLLVLVLDTADFQSADHAIRLMVEVRNVLMPAQQSERSKPVQHLAGTVSWEGLQQCLLCGKTLAKNCHDGGMPLPSGYVFEIGTRFTSEACDEYSLCV